MSSKAYDDVTRIFARLHRIGHLGALAAWDQAVMMPLGGNAARGAAMAELDVLVHEMLTSPQLKDALHAAQQEELLPMQRANLREMRRAWEPANLLPASLVEAKSLAGTRCEHAWREQRPAHDWDGFVVNLREVVRLSREEAGLLAQFKGCSPYDALVDRFEPGMTSATIDTLFQDVAAWLPGLIGQVQAKQAVESVNRPRGPFPREGQRALAVKVMELLGFDFSRGRLDVSIHPFCGGVPEDVRITTRYDEDDVTRSLMGVIHETGHGCYEQNLPQEWLEQPVGTARSMAIHESQSLLYEMQLSRSPAFLRLITPLIREHCGDRPGLSADNLARCAIRVSPGRIRVDADEVCYPAHIMLRFEIERDLINSRIEVEDIPGIWDEKMQAYLGVDTSDDFRDGPMQDIHWAQGAFGYFPSYTLGAMYAAQLFAAIRNGLPDVDDQVADGNLSPIFDWLRSHIWSRGSGPTTGELIREATGEELNPAYFRGHLEARYLG
ncbi:MAG: carboxypeptidase M32 [Desulfovibrionales bacterium]|nr:MAG: carboxypeptidase M32 [Desulfovibrionales bacterium]